MEGQGCGAELGLSPSLLFWIFLGFLVSSRSSDVLGPSLYNLNVLSSSLLSGLSVNSLMLHTLFRRSLLLGVTPLLSCRLFMSLHSLPDAPYPTLTLLLGFNLLRTFRLAIPQYSRSLPGIPVRLSSVSRVSIPTSSSH